MNSWATKSDRAACCRIAHQKARSGLTIRPSREDVHRQQTKLHGNLGCRQRTQFASIFNIPEFDLAAKTGRGRWLMIHGWAITNGEHGAVSAETSALKHDVTRRRERVQNFSTRAFNDRDHAGVWFHYCNDTAIRTQDAVRLFRCVGSDAKTAARAQIPTRAYAGNQLEPSR